jgi:hypothetical protein
MVLLTEVYYRKDKNGFRVLNPITPYVPQTMDTSTKKLQSPKKASMHFKTNFCYGHTYLGRKEVSEL